MKSLSCVAAVATLATLTIADSTLHKSLHSLKVKRGYLTCQETYGDGSTTCGGIDSHFCYGPSAGEVSFAPKIIKYFRTDSVCSLAVFSTMATAWQVISVLQLQDSVATM